MDRTIEGEVARLEKDLIAMKSPQPIGSNSVTAYETLTNFVWDYDHTMASNNYNGISYTHGVYVKFTARNQSAPFAHIRVLAQINGVRYNPLTSTNSNGGPTTNPSTSFIEIYEDIFNTGSLKDYAQDNVVRWRINTSSKLIGTNIKIKVIVTATDMGILELKPFNSF